MKKIIYYILFTLITISLNAQGEYKWGVSRKTGKAKYAFLQINYNGNNYDACRSRVQWLIDDAPNLHKDLYVMGAEVYKQAEKNETDLDKKKTYQDSVLFMYDQQVERFNLEAEALNYKGKVAYNYLAKRGGQTDVLIKLYDRIVELNDSNTFIENAYFYLALSGYRKKKGEITDLELYNRYNWCTSLVAFNKEKYAGNDTYIEYYDSYQARFDKLFNKYVDMTCENIELIFGKESYTLEEAKNVLNLLKSASCTSSSLYEKTITKIITEEPSPEGTNELAELYLKQGKTNSAIKKYKEILKSSASNSLKGKSAIALMKIYSKQSNKEKTRDYGKQAIALGAANANVYNTIGNLYMNSLNDCKTEDVVKTRAIFIAAHELFKKAGDTALMAKAKEQFPSKEELFLGTYEVGQQINTGCWINETVTLQTR